MNLLIEIGNTALKAAWAEGITLGKTFRYQGEKPLEFIYTLTEKEKPEKMVISSVYDISAEDAAGLAAECHSLLLLDPSHKEVLRTHSLPEYLSYDRAASIIAAGYLFKGKGVTLVDFGTTLTIDFTDPSGSYKGGNISVGCRTRFKALNRYSRRLPLVNTPDEAPQTGTSIESSIEAGVISGIIFEIGGYLGENPSDMVVFTGGDANYFAKRMKKSIFVVPNLVLMGLALIAESDG